jgi:hypothetical protein
MLLHATAHILRPALLQTCVYLFALPALLLGCAGGNARFDPGGERDRPEVAEILADLRANDAAIDTLEAAGTLALRAPEFEAAQRLDGRLVFARPDAVYMEGRKVGSLVIWMADTGQDGLLVLPRKKHYYVAEGGMLAVQSGRTFAPAALLRELLFSEGWTDVAPGDLRLVKHVAEAGVAELEFGTDMEQGMRRRVVVRGRPWVVVESRVIDAQGNVQAVSYREDYVVVEGVRLPQRIMTEFPGEGAFLNLTVRKYTVNQEADPSRFDIGEHVKTLEFEGFQRGALSEEDLAEALP